MGKGSFQVKKPEKRNIFFETPKLYKLSKTITYSRRTLYKPINLYFCLHYTFFSITLILRSKSNILYQNCSNNISKNTFLGYIEPNCSTPDGVFFVVLCLNGIKHQQFSTYIHYKRELKKWCNFT